MKFSEFLLQLKKRFPCKSKERFAMQILSALCGESEPIPTNSDSKSAFKYSEKLPPGLTGMDGKARKDLYNAEGNGLSSTVREHILAYKNKDTFLAYCKNISEREFHNLCKDFGFAIESNENLVFEAIFEQFLEFAKTPDDNANNIIEKRANGSTVEKTSTKNHHSDLLSKSADVVANENAVAIKENTGNVAYQNKGVVVNQSGGKIYVHLTSSDELNEINKVDFDDIVLVASHVTRMTEQKEYNQAIKFLNDLIKEKNDKEFLKQLFKFKSEIYSTIGGSLNLFFALLCNKAAQNSENV